MTTRRRSAVAITLGLVAIGATGLGTIATGRGDRVGPAAAMTSPPPTPTTAATATTVAPNATPTPIPTTRPVPATAAPSTTAATTTTIAPIPTYAADIGVLSPVAVAAPVAVSLPALGIDGRVIPTGVNDQSELDVPPDARTLVWYRFGPTPGAPGSAVIAGHLDWRGVEGIFSDLAATPVGAPFTVTYDDGSERGFVVRSVDLVDKPAVAVNGVFARDGESVLRLVTCGGEFDRATRHYRSNVVVTAVPA